MSSERQPTPPASSGSSPGGLDDTDRRLLSELSRDPRLSKSALARRTGLSTPEVGECHRVTGEDCFVIRVHAPSLEAMEQVLDAFLLHGQTTSAITVSSPVPPRALPIMEPGRSDV